MMPLPSLEFMAQPIYS
uniref:Uncharacterized protein n=1 Tax=Arundo donax TaxID=35708 RepID=A0A0A8ZQ56_ARUDO